MLLCFGKHQPITPHDLRRGPAEGKNMYSWRMCPACLRELFILVFLREEQKLMDGLLRPGLLLLHHLLRPRT